MSKKTQVSSGAIAGLRETFERLVVETDKPNLSHAARRKLEKEIRLVVGDLSQFLNELDPIRQPSAVFDPSNPKIVGRFVSLALVAQQRHPLSEIERSYGSGVYAIYYKGDYALYRPISGTETPIYVGQAAPAINNARTPMEQGDQLCSRLTEHRKNISKATDTLDIADFEFRSLVVQSGWETAAEDYLIHLFQPIWNKETKILYGLGKHGDSAKTRANKRSPWDTLHQGRNWAVDEILSDAKSPEQIASELSTHFAKHPVFAKLDDVLSSFIEELRQA